MVGTKALHDGLGDSRDEVRVFGEKLGVGTTDPLGLVQNLPPLVTLNARWRAVLPRVDTHRLELSIQLLGQNNDLVDRPHLEVLPVKETSLGFRGNLVALVSRLNRMARGNCPIAEVTLVHKVARRARSGP